jgi:hypothetical protein
MDRTRLTVRLITAASAVFLAILHVPASPAGRGSDEDYRAIFGDKYAEAEKYLADNPWISGDLRLPREETAIALAIVFPEISVQRPRRPDPDPRRRVGSVWPEVRRPFGRYFQIDLRSSNIRSRLESPTSAEEKAAAGIPAFVMRMSPICAGTDPPSRRSAPAGHDRAFSWSHEEEVQEGRLQRRRRPPALLRHRI